MIVSVLFVIKLASKELSVLGYVIVYASIAVEEILNEYLVIDRPSVTSNNRVNSD